MANLTNFLEPQPIREAEVTAKTELKYKELEDLRGICDNFLRQGIFTGGAFENLSQPEKDIVAREESLMLGIWQEDKFLPAEMANSVLGEANDGEIAPYQRRLEPLVRYSTSPQTELKHIRNAAEKLSFAVVPYEYINQDGIVAKYAEEGQPEYAQEIREGFKAVDELCAAVNTFEEIETYILCPVGFYDPWQEVRDSQTRQKIFGGELSQIEMILGMLMPTQKNLYQMSKINAENIEQLRGTMEANFTEVSRTLDNIQGKISWLTDQVFVARRQANRATDIAESALATAEWAAYRLLCLLDPLIFTVPQGTDIRQDDVNAHLLMCFGADMPLDFFLRRGLVQVDNNGYYDSIVRTYK